MEEKGNKIILILIILMFMALSGTIVYSKMLPKKKKTSDIIEPKKEEKKDKKEEVTEEKYINYTTANIEIKNKGTLNLNIKNGTFTMKFNNTNLKLTGINEKIKSFTYDQNAYVVARNNNGIIILLLSENNTVYVGFYEENDNTLYFRKINTNLKIKDITLNEIIQTNKSSIKTSVVLDNNEIRPIIESGNVYIISNKDVSKIEKVLDNIVIYKDGTLSTTSNMNAPLKYKDQNMVISRILSVKAQGDLTKEYSKCYYIITNNKLFKLCGNTRGNTKPSNFGNIELVDNKAIIETTPLDKGYTEKEMDYVLTFDDNTQEVLKIEKAYIR